MLEFSILLLIIFPLIIALSMGLLILLSLNISEKLITQLISITTISQVIISVFCFINFCLHGDQTIVINLNHWFTIGTYEFELTFLYDRLSAPFTLLISVLGAIAAKYSSTYLHREKGFNRFFLLYLVFLTGSFFIVLAGTIDLLFAGWELVGISSVLLISFFHHQVSSVKNSFRAIITYRICDIGFLAGSAWMHFTFHASRFDHIFSNLNWPNGEIHTHSTSLLFISLCFILASLAKSAQLPMSGWLPGAFEGPTPSSAIFYGAISIHMGAYLLLRMYPLFEAVPISKTIIFVIGFSTALYATFVGRTRTDAKTILAYSTMAHVGVIYCEIALGFHFIAVFHICAHASLRTFQFLRSSSLIHDFLDNSLIYENTIIRKDGFYEKVLPLKWQQYLYHVSLNRLFLDHYLNKFFISPFIFVSEFVFKTEDSYAKFFNKDQSAELAEYFDDTEV